MSTIERCYEIIFDESSVTNDDVSIKWYVFVINVRQNLEKLPSHDAIQSLIVPRE